jgi:hypothetical protein
MDRSSAKRLSAFFVSVAAAMLLAPLALFGAEKAAASSSVNPRVLFPKKHATTRALRDNLKRPAQGSDRRDMLFLPPHVKNHGAASKPTDTATIQRSTHGILMPDPILSFEGVDDPDGVQPGDTTMAVGPNHVVQWVNLSFQVFDRSGNDLSGGPIEGTSFWTDLGGDCANVNGGDIIIRYDYLADRWFVTQLAAAVQGASTNNVCLAMSTSGDPLGTYVAYDYEYSPTDLNDYPKWGMWPDAYYGTFRNFQNAQNFTGMVIWAIDRNALIAGNPSPTVLELGPGSVNPNLDGLLPSDLSGGSLVPPGGEPTVPNTLAGIGSPDYDGSLNAVVHLYQFHPDFTTPANSTFTGPVDLTVPDFDFNVSPTQPDNVGMESLPFPMYRVDYRNFGDHESIVFNHTVNVGGGRPGVRWYQISDPRGTPAIAQQGTFGPDDTDGRWFGSVATDVSGDIAMGYSAAGSSTFPAVRYAGRLVGDPPGEMSQGEGEIVSGNGNFDGGRWGDYSTIVVDPVDQCTFWYTTMYVAGTGSADWATRVGSFKFPNCVAGPSGTLSGIVTDGTNPLPGAKVTAGAESTNTDASGNYSFTLPVGTYDMIASKYGFFPSTASGVVVTEGNNTVQNFVLAAAPSVTVNGVVKDGSGGGWPLYAKIVITGPGAPTFTIYTDPVTGYYSQTLVAGITYTFQVTSTGYNPGGGAVPLGPTRQAPNATVQNWTLTVDAQACIAPGYTQSIGGLVENFDSGTLPKGWSIVNDPASFGEWSINTGPDPCGAFSGNATGGAGPYALANSNCDGVGTFDDTSLVTPTVDMTSFATATLRFMEDYKSLDDEADADISIDGGTSWTNVLSQTADARGPKTVSIDITGIAAGHANVKARFHYFNAFWAWWWQVDNVLLGSASCNVGSGGLLVGNVTDAGTGLGINGATVQELPDGASTTTGPSAGAGDGYYTLFAESGSGSFQASKALYAPQTKTMVVIPNSTQRLDFSLSSGHLTASPTPLAGRVDPNGTTTQILNITNTGTVAATFTILEMNAPASSSLTHGFVSQQLRQEALDRLPKDGKGTPVASARSTRGIPALQHPRPSRPLAAGDVSASYPSGITYGWGVATSGITFWLSNLGVAGGDNLDYAYGEDGALTGATIDDAPAIDAWAGDGTFNARTAMMWRVDVVNSGSSCIFELNPTSKTVTGNTICPATNQSSRGLAYDSATDTYWVGSWNDGTIFHFDASGSVLDSAFVSLAVSGLAYNKNNGHLLAMQNIDNATGDDITVLDANNNYAVLGSYNVMDNGSKAMTAFGQAGMEFDCLGNLWVIDQNTQTIYNVISDEAVLCSVDIPWLSEDPTTGTVPGVSGAHAPAGGSNVFPVTITYDATGLFPGLRQAQLLIKTDTPIAVPAVPVTLTVRFLDVPDANQFQAFIYGAAGAGVMMGGPPNCPAGIYDFCPDNVVTRADMAGYIFRAVHGSSTPPPVYQNIFADVTFNDYNAFYIQGIFDDGITAGCGFGNYCPNSPNTRAQMSVFVWKGQHGSEAPPACTPPGIFSDVACPGGFAVDYIEGLFNEGVTAGCGGGNFCPDANITNGQMAVFLVKGFNIPYLP